MRIFIHDYAGHPFAVELSRDLACEGHTVMHGYAGALQTPRGDLAKRETDPDSFTSQQIEMNRDYVTYKYSFLKRREMEIEYGKKCAALIREWKPDVVLSANTPTESQQHILSATKAMGARFVIWVQDFYSLAVDKLVRKKLPFVGSFIGGYYKRMERMQLVNSDHIVAITEDFVPIMEKEFGISKNKVTTIPNWAPVENLPVLKKDNAWSREYGMNNQFVFLYSGTLGMKHNPDLLLQLAVKYQDDPNVRVMVISEGMGARWLMEQKAEHHLKNIHILAYQPFEVMAQVMASGDVLIAVLEEDAGVFSVPSKVLTYLCARRPLLLAVPQVNLAARIIEETSSGLTVAPNDLTGFLNAAEVLRSQPQKAEQCAANGRGYAEATFDIHSIALRFGPILGLTASVREACVA